MEIQLTFIWVVLFRIAGWLMYISSILPLWPRSSGLDSNLYIVKSTCRADKCAYILYDICLVSLQIPSSTDTRVNGGPTCGTFT
jgi:hypothetical protein